MVVVVDGRMVVELVVDDGSSWGEWFCGGVHDDNDKC